MRLTHPDYIKLVIETYYQLRATGKLPASLSTPTPAKIKKECLQVYQRRHLKKDEAMLRDFFDPAQTGREFLYLIRRIDRDKFRPLNNFFYGKTEKTDDKNVYLLAWLIDFQHRPYVYDMDVHLSEGEVALISESAPGQSGIPEAIQTGISVPEEIVGLQGAAPAEKIYQNAKGDIPGSPGGVNRNGIQKWIAAVLVLVVASVGAWMWKGRNKEQMVMGSSNNVCMYWATDHYEKVPCNEAKKGRIFLALNEQSNLRRIMQVDTITKWCIGKVYYIKDSGIIKYYTQAGNYPEDTRRVLKILTPYMFNKYLDKTGKDSLNNLNLKAAN